MTDFSLGLDGLLDVTAVSEVVERRRLKMFLRHKLGVIALAFLVLLTLAAILAPWINPFTANLQTYTALLQAPSTHHLLGTDYLGRDILSRLLLGARVSLEVGALSVLMSMAIAVPIGFIAGFRGGIADRAVQILVDVLLSIPPLILIFAIDGALGPSVANVIIALGVFFVPLFMRLTRQETRHLRESQLVEAERAVGLSDGRIARRHVLPHLLPPLLVQASLSAGIAIIAEAALSFLGLGVVNPTPSWGGMMATARTDILTHPMQVVPGAVAVLLTVLAFSLLSDSLRDTFGRVAR